MEEQPIGKDEGARAVIERSGDSRAEFENLITDFVRKRE